MTPAQFDEAKGLVRRMIELIGDEPSRDGLRETPDRVVRSWSELFAGYHIDPVNYAKEFDEVYDEMIVVKNIGFRSFCEHHMLPFTGKVDVGYIPEGKKIIGLSKVARMVEAITSKLQVQERIVKEIADTIEKSLSPLGVGVIMEAGHSCTACRGSSNSIC